MEWITRVADKAGVVGSVVSAAACPACLPALTSLGAAMGLGIFAEYEESTVIQPKVKTTVHLKAFPTLKTGSTGTVTWIIQMRAKTTVTQTMNQM